MDMRICISSLEQNVSARNYVKIFVLSSFHYPREKLIFPCKTMTSLGVIPVLRSSLGLDLMLGSLLPSAGVGHVSGACKLSPDMSKLAQSSLLNECMTGRVDLERSGELKVLLYLGITGAGYKNDLNLAQMHCCTPV